MIHLKIALEIVAVAVCFCDLLTKRKMIFARYGVWLESLEINDRLGWIAYPIGYCSKCTAGQIAMWVFIGRAVSGWEPESLVAIRFVVFCSVTVLASEIVSAWVKRLQR